MDASRGEHVSFDSGIFRSHRILLRIMASPDISPGRVISDEEKDLEMQILPKIQSLPSVLEINEFLPSKSNLDALDLKSDDISIEKNKTFELYLATLVEMGIPFEKAEIALTYTKSDSIEDAIAFIYMNEDALWHKFESLNHSVNCSICGLGFEYHLIDKGGYSFGEHNMQSIHFSELDQFLSSISPREYLPRLSNRERMIHLQQRSNAAAGRAREYIKSIEDQKGHNTVDTGYCGICLEIVNIFELSKSKCGHAFCLNCLKTYFRVTIREGRVLGLKCLEHECNRMFTEQEILLAVDSVELKRKYERFKWLSQMRENPNCRWCPAPDCETPVIGCKRTLKLKCTRESCGVEFCFNCSHPWHEGVPCETMIDQQYSKWAKGKDVQNCPKCRARIQKLEGCNHMTCSACFHEFCWLCRGQYSPYHYLWWNFMGCPSSQFAFASSNAWRPHFIARTSWRALTLFSLFIYFIIAIACAGIAIAVGLVAMVVIIVIAIIVSPCVASRYLNNRPFPQTDLNRKKSVVRFFSRGV